MRSHRTAPALAGALIALLLLAVSACSPGSSDNAGRHPEITTEATAEVSPTPPASPDGTTDPPTPPADRTDPTTQAPPPAQPGDSPYEKARKLAACMRANGVPDFPDPNPDGSFSPDMFGNLDMMQLQQVFLTKCREYSLGRH